MIASDPNVAKVELIAAALGALRERLVLNQREAATIILYGRKNMSVTPWFTVLRNQTGQARIFQKSPSSLPCQRLLL